MVVYHCADCRLESSSGSFAKAASDAEWHNTMKGHDVAVVVDDQVWELTDAGWVKVEDEVALVRVALDYGVEL